MPDDEALTIGSVETPSQLPRLTSGGDGCVSQAEIDAGERDGYFLPINPGADNPYEPAWRTFVAEVTDSSGGSAGPRKRAPRMPTESNPSVGQASYLVTEGSPRSAGAGSAGVDHGDHVLHPGDGLRPGGVRRSTKVYADLREAELAVLEERFGDDAWRAADL